MKEARAFSRIQLGNSDHVKFALHDSANNESTAYCICTDLSESGAHFFTDREFELGRQLELTVSVDNKPMETLAVTVIRADSSLNDEERYCAAVRFNQPFKLFERLTFSRGKSNSIAA